MTEGQGTNRWRWTISISVALTAGVVLLALASGIRHRQYDVDEIQHAHVTWRISAGDRPFHDFVETHPPFVWYLGAPLVGAISRPQVIAPALRVLAAASGLAFVGLLLASLKVKRPSLRIPWLLAGALLVLSDPRNLDYFMEIRPDSAAYVLLFLAVYLFLRGRPRHLFPRYAVFAFLASTSVLWSPKLALLVVIFAVADLGLSVPSRDALPLALTGHATGILLAAAVAVIALRAAGIDPLLAYNLSIGFHQRFLATTSFSHGLLQSILDQPVPLIAAAAGAFAWMALILRKRIRPTALEIAILGFLIVTPFYVHFPYKQYFAPWFALAAGFVAFAGIVLPGLGKWVARLALLGVLAVAFIGGLTAFRNYSSRGQVRFFHVLWEQMDRVAVTDGRVVAAPHWHPINRRAVLYGWFLSFDPGGRDQEAIFREWNPGGYGSRFTRKGYRAELDRRPPAIILTLGDGFSLPPTQEEVVAEYLQEHRDRYLRVEYEGGLALLVDRNQANWRYLEAAGHAASD